MMNYENTNTIEVKGKPVRELYYNLDSKYRIILFKSNIGDITIRGSFQELNKTDTYILLLKPAMHPKYGLQYDVIKVTLFFNDNEGLVKFLSSKSFKNIGIQTATRIVNDLGKDLINLIKKDNKLLDKLTYLNDKKKKSLINGIKKINYEDDIKLELLNLGLTYYVCEKLISKYQDKTLDIINENPYIIIKDIEGFGFKKCDKIALQRGFDKRSSLRIKQGILFTIKDYCYNTRDTYILEDKLYNKVLNILDLDFESLSLVRDSLIELSKDEVIIDDNKLYLTSIWNSEFNISTRLKKINKCKYLKFNLNKIDYLIKEFEKYKNIIFNEKQKEILTNIFNDKISIITGGPGTGKSTVIEAIYTIFKILNPKININICAPTGKAAKRIKFKNCDAKTIHKLLDYNGEEFSYNFYNKLYTDLIIVDESSMIDIFLASALLDALPNSARIIFVGDINQLPSINPGNFLHDIIESNIFKVYRLEKILRQLEDSNILKLANMVLNNNVDFSLLNYDKKDINIYNLPNNYNEFIINLYKKYLVNNDINKIKILIPIYEGIHGINITNEIIQANFFKNDKVYKYLDKNFYLNDLILNLKNINEKNIMNGDVGKIIEVNDDNILVDFDDSIEKLNKDNISDITLAYAMSVHKSQGSEYDTIILPIYKDYHIMLEKHLLYTAITRAKKRLIIVGDPNILVNRIRENTNKRNTSLIDKLLKNNI